MMKSFFQAEVLKLKNDPYTDQKTLDTFIARIETNEQYTRDENPTDHLCSIFLPIDLKSKTIFLGHHIKANSWMPPGGHIDKDETTIDAIKREFTEELQYNLTSELIELFTVSIIHIDTVKNIDRKKVVCKIHNDFWYLVYMNQFDFQYDTKEFYDAKWVNISEAANMISIPLFQEQLTKLNHKLSTV